MRGKILSVIAGVYRVFLENSTIVSLTPKGKFRLLKIKPCVGDNVEVVDQVISHIYPRSNQLVRPSISNLDLGIIVVSLDEPKYSSFLLDKFLTMLNMNKIKPLIILSKGDLADQKNVDAIIEEYSKIDIDILPFSKYNQVNLDLIKEKIKGKTIAFMGQTGVGKSSLINALCPSFQRKVGEYSQSLNRGKHQTKEVIIYPYENGFIADTPGFSSLELTCFKEELKDYFPFFQKVEQDCFYLNCSHTKEPKCVIQEMVKEGKISTEHYDNYLQIYDELIFRKDRFK